MGMKPILQNFHSSRNVESPESIQLRINMLLAHLGSGTKKTPVINLEVCNSQFNDFIHGHASSLSSRNGQASTNCVCTFAQRAADIKQKLNVLQTHSNHKVSEIKKCRSHFIFLVDLNLLKANIDPLFYHIDKRRKFKKEKRSVQIKLKHLIQLTQSGNR